MYFSGAGHNGVVTAELGSSNRRPAIIPAAVALIVAEFKHYFGHKQIDLQRVLTF